MVHRSTSSDWPFGISKPFLQLLVDRFCGFSSIKSGSWSFLVYIYEHVASIWQCCIQLISVLLLSQLSSQHNIVSFFFAVTVIVDKWWHTKRQAGVTQHCWPIEIKPSFLTALSVTSGLFSLVCNVAESLPVALSDLINRHVYFNPKTTKVQINYATMRKMSQQ